jgi:peptidoglycan/LPS O-acetylase OafA/YrhL
MHPSPAHRAGEGYETLPRRATFAVEGSRTTASSQALSLWLYLFRWLAAFDVLWGHVYNRYLLHVRDLPGSERGVAHLLFAFPAGFLHFAVMGFFVLSGYLVGGRLLQEVRETNRIDTKAYLVKRLVRLWIVLLPGLILTLALTWIGLSLQPAVYGPEIVPALGPRTFACNALFLQTVLCGEYGDNFALWSLAYELWYYLAWLLFVVIFIRGLSILAKAIAVSCGIILLAALTIRQFDGVPIALYMVIWLIGLWAATARRPLFGASLKLSTAVFLAYAIGFRLLVRDAAHLPTARLFLADFIMSITFANMLIAMRLSPGLRPPPGAGAHRHLAGFSYSLYATHQPVLNCLGALAVAAIGFGWHMMPEGFGAWAVILAAMAAAILAAYLFSLATEAQTNRLRRRVLALLARSASLDVHR